MESDHDPAHLQRLVDEGAREVARLDRKLLELREARRIFLERKGHFYGVSLNFGGIMLHVVTSHALTEMDALIEATRQEQLTRRLGMENDAHELANVLARSQRAREEEARLDLMETMSPEGTIPAAPPQKGVFGG